MPGVKDHVNTLQKTGPQHHITLLQNYVLECQAEAVPEINSPFEAIQQLSSGVLCFLILSLHYRNALGYCQEV